MAIWRFIRCSFGWCGGHLVSGTHDGVVWIGWQCDTCGVVKHYAPAEPYRWP
jgi:hypothetical protein